MGLGTSRGTFAATLLWFQGMDYVLILRSQLLGVGRLLSDGCCLLLHVGGCSLFSSAALAFLLLLLLSRLVLIVLVVAAIILVVLRPDE